MNKNKTGELYVVATPIGNLQDITLRAIEILNKVDRIAAEDTRHAAHLLKHFSIKKPIISLHEFNEREQFTRLLNDLEQGQSIALISDAGTPLISDPGFHLVREAKKLDIRVVPIPGPCAAIAALSVAGLPTDKFVFEGFLPAKQEARRKRLQQLASETRTMIFYEAPHRLLEVLDAMLEIFGDTRKIVMARELTKIHETVIIGNIKNLITRFKNNEEEQCGEMVLLVEGEAQQNDQAKEILAEKVLNILLQELPLKQAVTLASQITGERKNVLYEKALMKKSIT